TSSLLRPATIFIYPLSLHDALPIWHNGFADDFLVIGFVRGLDRIGLLVGLFGGVRGVFGVVFQGRNQRPVRLLERQPRLGVVARSEEHTSELQSRVDLVCRLLLEKK